MDRRFSKHEYIISCTLTLVFVALVAAAYFDISTCPYVYDRPTSTAPLLSAVADHATCGSCGDESHKSLIASLTSPEGGGFSCHMVDVIVWAYVAGLVVFMAHKYVTYRLQGLHYFLLDYCYFHNAALVGFLLWRLVDVKWSSEPIWSWSGSTAPPPPPPLQSGNSSGPAAAAALRQGGGSTAWQHPLLTGTSMGNTSWARRLVAAQVSAPPYRLDGIYRPVSVDLLTCGYVVAHLTEAELLSSFLIFFMLLAGSLGPILGAIIVWRNALLFHSFDRMSSCYLHLAPAIVQGLLLHRLFTSARREMEQVDAAGLFQQATMLALKLRLPVEELLPSLTALMDQLPSSSARINTTELRVMKTMMAKNDTLPLSGRVLHNAARQFSKYAARHQMEALCGVGTLCYDLRRTVTLRNLLLLHLLMFVVWQIVYHAFNEHRRLAREKTARRRLAELEKKKTELMRLTGATADEAELLRPLARLNEGILGNPGNRMTSYVWMMANPPGGKDGIAYRLVTICGTGRLPTTVLFQLVQWCLHVIFIAASYPVIYFCFHHAMSAWPLLCWVLWFVALCIYNAACVDKKWIGKLQQMAAKGMEAERQAQALTEPATLQKKST